MAVKSGVKVKGLREVQGNFLKFSRVIGQGRKAAFNEAGIWAVDLIIAKTTSGKDFTGTPFKKYSDKYETKKGRTKVDLVQSGRMLGAISFQAFAKKLRIYVKKTGHGGKINSYELAVVHNFGAKAGKKHKAKIPSREFMGLTAKDVEQILKIVRKFYEKELAKIF